MMLIVWRLHDEYADIVGMLKFALRKAVPHCVAFLPTHQRLSNAVGGFLYYLLVGTRKYIMLMRLAETEVDT